VIPAQMAIVFGSETVGCSETMLQAADKRVYVTLTLALTLTLTLTF
jgi:tRNA G18 (ribose-2'-O)-methylase SpoU